MRIIEVIPQDKAANKAALPHADEASRSPTISIVLPVFREGLRLGRVLDCIAGQTWPRDDMEVIVADGGSDDETGDVCRRNSDRLQIRLLTVPSRGRVQGLNYGIRQARGAFVLRIDGRSVVPPDFIERLHQTAVVTGAAVVGGVQRAIAPSGAIWQSAIALSMNSICGAGPANHRRGARSGPNDNVYLGLYRRNIFDKIGYFDEKSPVISEDVDIHRRMAGAGEIVWLDADMIIPYEARSRLIDQFWLYFRYGGAQAALLLKYKQLITFRQLVAPGFFASVAVLLLASPFIAAARWLLGAEVLAYAVAALSCAAIESQRQGHLELMFHVVAVSSAMHLGYAVGYFRRLLIRDRTGRYWSG